MQTNLISRPQQPRGPVGIGVAQQKHDLEENYGAGPHARRAAEPRQHRLAPPRLDQEKQQRAAENRAPVEQAANHRHAYPPRYNILFMNPTNLEPASGPSNF